MVTLGDVQTTVELDSTDNPDRLSAGPQWSPDASELAWVLGRELRIGSPDGTGWRAMPPASSPRFGFPAGPVIWSSDSQAILEGHMDTDGDSDVKWSLVVYEVITETQPDEVLPLQENPYGRVSWQVIHE
jgi:hypothetical protein